MLVKGFYLLKDLVAVGGSASESFVHIDEALKWIYRAQDATPDRGVSHSYLIGKGWMQSYPETTGYIIPTLLNWHNLTGEAEPRKRALEMADWESSIQFESGAVSGSVVGRNEQKPVVFNTGQVLFGWVAAYRHTKDTKYLASARRAADWLLESLDKEFTWRKHGNMGSDATHTYNVRVAWAVLELALVTNDKRYFDAMKGFVNWALSEERGRGWFDHNCLNDNSSPLLHTIAYTAQGLLECGLILNDERSIGAARRTSDELINKIEKDGRMSGRFNNAWEGTVKWSCLTGMAQMAIVWQRLYKLTRDGKYMDAATRVNAFLKKTQDISGRNNGVRGGIKGSLPVNGQYGRYRLLNWAAKFFLDGLLLEMHPDIQDSNDYYGG